VAKSFDIPKSSLSKILNAIAKSVQCSSQPVSAECEDMDSEDPHPVVTVKEAQGALHTLQSFS